MKNNYIFQAWLVIVLAVAFGATLAGVQTALSGRIEENKRRETSDQIPNLVPSATRSVEYVSPDGKIAHKAFDGKDEHCGWVIKGVGQGFADKIEVLIGLNKDADRITGLYVLDQKETPALGDRIREPQWRGQFEGLDASRTVTVTKTAPAAGENEIQAVSGATVSSNSVCNIVNNAAGQFRDQLDTLKPKSKDKE